MSERIGDGDLTAKRVVGVGRFVAEQVDGLGDAALRVVDDLRCVAATISLRGLATKGVVGVGGGDAGGGAGGDGQAVAGDRFGGKRRVWGSGRLCRRVGCAVEVGAGDCFVVESVEGVGLGGEEPRASASRRGRRRYGVTAQPGEAGAGEAHKRQLGGAVLARLPG